ncbi:MAG: hypothetical protein R2742_12615 [Micropruina glycogenica]
MVFAISAPISAFIFGGATGGGTGALVGMFQAMGQSRLGATTLQGLLSDPLDKLISFTVVYLVLSALPARFKQRFPFVRQYQVFGKAPAAKAWSCACRPRCTLSARRRCTG